METTSKRYIDVTDTVKSKLAKLFKCTEKFVYMALTYRKDSLLAKKIRYVAVRDYQGKPMHHCPECETLHNLTQDGRKLMVQNFDNGVKLEVDKGTGNVVVYNRKGDNIGNWENVTVTKLSEIQLYAESL
jgi:hypothetical protein|nr:MAG TPA: hydrogenase/urease nickel incorporation protein [Caudoviricetes sp.]